MISFELPSRFWIPAIGCSLLFVLNSLSDTKSTTGGVEVSGDKQVDDGPEGNERIDSDQDVQRDGDGQYEDNLEYDTHMDYRGQNEVASTTDEPKMFADECPRRGHFEITDWVDNVDIFENEESTSQRGQVSGLNDRVMVVTTKQTALQRLTFVGHDIFPPVQIREIDWVTYFLPKINPASKDKETLVVMNKPTPVEEHCQLVLNSAWDDVCARMETFDEWMHLRKELYELEVQKSIVEHVANFKTTETSVNHDYMCIRLLSKELREIVGLHRAQRTLAGLPIEAPEASIAGDDAGSNTLQLIWSSMEQSQIPALDVSTQKEQELEVNRKLAQPDERIEEIVRTTENVDGIEIDSKQGQVDPDEQHLDQDNEHQAHNKRDNVQQTFLTKEHQHQGSTDNPTQLADPSVNIVDTANTLGPDPTSEDNRADHQGPNPSLLQMVSFMADSEEDTRLSFLNSSKSSSNDSTH
ncbi:hypothetical protein F511_03550 [Dorcoceras hygrometricum]|uniref:Uncharacterized protein n=1 Tax=Dorcoceras hygrometricum TaxID=472368 RepID=A0A2Z7BRE2_9LAMI|nr:hypothetical protein F511_03550 [Dorcoceras hygrometricum]